MLNIKEELMICLMRKGLSLRKVIKLLKDKGIDVPCSSGLSVLLNKKRVRFETVQEILDYLGYELVIKEKRDK